MKKGDLRGLAGIKKRLYNINVELQKQHQLLGLDMTNRISNELINDAIGAIDDDIIIQQYIRKLKRKKQ